jgi:hypothetical protein
LRLPFPIQSRLFSRVRRVEGAHFRALPPILTDRAELRLDADALGEKY